MPNRAASGGSWQVLAATPRGRNGWPAMMVAVVSSPSLGPTLMLGVQDTTRSASEFLMAWEPLTQAESFADAVQFEVLEVEAAPVNFEAILIEPVLAGPRPVGGVPLVVMPHGGPHSVHSTAFTTYASGLALLGHGNLVFERKFALEECYMDSLYC
jgi:hypothetical protein